MAQANRLTVSGMSRKVSTSMCIAAASGSSRPKAFLKAMIDSASSPFRSSLPGGRIPVTYPAYRSRSSAVNLSFCLLIPYLCSSSLHYSRPRETQLQKLYNTTNPRSSANIAILHLIQSIKSSSDPSYTKENIENPCPYCTSLKVVNPEK